MRKHPMTLSEAMMYVSEMGQRAGAPDCYLWASKWWRLYAKRSACPWEALGYARSQLALYRDMKARPEHYASPFRPKGVSDWQWSGLSASTFLYKKAKGERQATSLAKIAAPQPPETEK